jgi:predicted metal-dependent phosphoesterase TrpH
MVDLHIHSSYSDGNLSPEQLLKLAGESGIKIMSITDHDSVEAYFQLGDGDIDKVYAGKLIPGVELTTTYNGEVIEILGYNIDPKIMREEINRTKIPSDESKQMLFDMMLDKYLSVGARIDEGFLLNLDMTRDIRRQFMQELASHPEENEHLFECKDSMTKYSSFLRKELYNSDSKLFIDFSPLKPSLDVVLDMVHKSGGKAFLAHTFVYSQKFINKLEKVLDDYDIDGVECYYSTFTQEQTDYLLDVCARKGLLTSGGSDFHGNLRPDVILSKATEGQDIPMNLITQWV